MPELLAAPTHDEMVSADGRFYIRADHTPGYTNILETEERWPDRYNETNLKTAMLKGALLNGASISEDDTRAWLSFVAPDHPGVAIERLCNFEGVVAGLGYELHTEHSQEDGEQITKRTFSYPSVDRVNTFTAAAFGKDRLEFVPYPGSEYRVTEFMERFINAGQVLMGSELPHTTHDLSDHALGWMGMPPQLVNTLQRGLGAYLAHDTLAREVLGQTVAELPIKQEGIEDPQMQDFLFPSAQVLEAAMLNLDFATSEFVRITMGMEPQESASVEHSLELAIQRLFIIRSDRPHSRLPNGLFRTDLDMGAVGTQMLARYITADQIGREMAAV